jgi:hypothetical protein
MDNSTGQKWQNKQYAKEKTNHLSISFLKSLPKSMWNRNDQGTRISFSLWRANPEEFSALLPSDREIGGGRASPLG